MFSKLSVFFLFFLFSFSAVGAGLSESQLNDRAIQHIIRTLPRMGLQLREAGITVSQAYYIWPRDAVLDAKGQVLLEQYGYDALRQDALEIFCKAWFYLNYDSLVSEREKLLSTFEEQMTENPYIEDDQKRINIRMLKKDLGKNKEELKQAVGEDNLRMVCDYRDQIVQAWERLND